jgi:Protein of unknown function (DUF2569)
MAKSHPQFSLTTWEALTVPGHASYHPMWAPVLLFESLANLTLIIGAVFACILFFGKRITFPRFYLAWLIAHPTILLIDYLLCLGLPAITAANRTKAAGVLGWAVVFSLIWGAYLLKSRRVKETFVK